MRQLRYILMLACMVLPARAAFSEPEAPPPTVRLGGAVELPSDWSVARITKELASELHDVELTSKGKAGKTKCVSLLALAQAARPKIDPKVKGHRLAFVAVVRGRDGYTATFSLGELLPEYGKREVWVGLDHDGAALDSEHAPVEIIVPADEKASRWVRGVESITIVDTSALGAKEASK